MKKFKIFSLAVFPLLLGIMAGCSGGTSSSSEKSGSSSSATPSTSTVGPSTSSAEPVSSSSETPTPSSSSSEEPVREDAAISLNGGELIPMTEYEPGEAGAISGYKIEGIDLTAGESIEFYHYGDLIDLDIGPEPGGCNVDVTGSEVLGFIFTIHNDAEGAYVYFKTWDTGGYSFWITGREDPTPATSGAYLMGMEGDLEIGVAFEPNELKPGEYVLEEFETNTTDALKVKFVPEEGDLVWAGYSQVEEGCKSLVASDGTENDNFIFVEEGVYTIYYKSGENTIWIENVQPTPEIDGFKMKVDAGEFIDLVETEIDGEVAWERQFTYKFDSISKGNRVDFYSVIDEEVALFTALTPSDDDVDNKTQNNLKPATLEGVDWTVLKDAAEATLYLELYQDGYKFWLQGGPELLTGYYLKINGSELVKLDENSKKPEDYEKEVMAIEVPLQQNDTFVIYNADENTDWTPELDQYTTKNITLDVDHFVVGATESYDFYLKLKFGADLLYVSEHESPVPGEPVYAYVLNEDEPVELTPGTDPDGNPQYEALDIEMEAGDKIFFENIAVEPAAVLDKLGFGDESAKHEFTIDKGVLTAGKDGTFLFYLKPASENDKVYISEKTEPVKAGAYLMGVGDDWTTGINMPFDEKEKTHEQYTYFGSFDNETELKVKFVPNEGETKWCGYSGVEEGCKSLVKQSPAYDHKDGQEPYSDDNFIFEAAGYYNLYYKADTDSIWIAKVETEYGFTMGENFYSVGTSGNAEYKFDSKNPLPVNAILGIASKDPSGNLTALPIDESAVTYNPAEFYFNSMNSTLSVLSSFRYVFTITFVDGQPVSLVAEQYVAPTTATVTITINYGTEMGQAVYITGNFNSWSPNVGVIRGVWTEGNDWVFEITQPVGQQVEFKFIINYYDNPTDPEIRKEGGDNRTYTFTVDESVTLSWQP